MIDKKLLEVLCCPDCRKDVELVNDELICVGCSKKYEIRDGIPVFV